MEEDISTTGPTDFEEVLIFNPSGWPMEEQFNTKDFSDFE